MTDTTTPQSFDLDAIRATAKSHREQGAPRNLLPALNATIAEVEALRKERDRLAAALEAGAWSCVHCGNGAEAHSAPERTSGHCVWEPYWKVPSDALAEVKAQALEDEGNSVTDSRDWPYRDRLRKRAAAIREGRP